jgi:uncharacterized protein (UPF0216 family)
MGFGFEVVRLDEGDFATLYSFRKEGEEDTELEKFWDKADVQRAPDHDNLKLRLYQDVLDRHNFEHPNCFSGKQPWFHVADKDLHHIKGKRVEALCALMDHADYKRLEKRHGRGRVPVLRLYCFRFRKVLIAGNGKVKGVKEIWKDDELKSFRNDVRYVMQRVYKRLRWTNELDFEEIEYDDGYVEDEFILEGNLTFEAPTSP